LGLTCVKAKRYSIGLPVLMILIKAIFPVLMIPIKAIFPVLALMVKAIIFILGW